MLALHMQLNENFFGKNPRETKLGRQILEHSIILIDRMGFERFTFRKLAAEISSTEASIYRYFDNKQNLLAYLVAWYWEWIKFQIGYQTMNIEDPRKRLSIVLSILVETSKGNINTGYIDTSILHNIIVAESTKAYHIKQVDEKNKEGFFRSYKTLCQKVADAILAVNPNYCYPHTLASTLIETANNNIYFAEHLPALTDIKYSDNCLNDIIKALEHMAFTILDNSMVTQPK